MALPVAMGNSFANPYSLGIATVTAGTAVRAIHNFTDLSQRLAHFMQFQAPSTNGGTVYVILQVGLPPWTLPGGGTTSGADTTNFLNVVYLLLPGASWSVPGFLMNNLMMGQFWIDGSNSGDICLAVAGEA